MHTAILLVDDEPAVLALLRRVMHDLAEDYDLIPVSDGATALGQIAQRSVAFVITDYRMPDMDGVALTAAIKVAAPQCPVILMTGYPTPEIEHNARMAGADFFLSKPFPLAQLDAVVRAALTTARGVQRAEPAMPPDTNRAPAIILVEDEPEILIILHRFMRDLTGGYDILAAADGAVALAQIEQRQVPLLITDYHLPRMNGLELARAVRRVSPDTRIALITGYATKQLASDAAAAGVTYYLPKPFNLDHLEAIVRAALA